jgi:hypothetical protein
MCGKCICLLFCLFSRLKVFGSFVQLVADGVQNRTTALVVLAKFSGMAMIFNFLLLLM